MSTFLSTRRGWILVLPVLPLCLAGLFTIQASSSPDQLTTLSDETTKQLFFAAAGIVCMVLTALIGYQRIGRFSYIIFGITILVLACLVIDRWFDQHIDPRFTPIVRAASQDRGNRRKTSE